MITLQDLDGNAKLYKCLLKNIKSKVSIFKRRSIKEIFQKDAASCEVIFISDDVEIENLEFLQFFPGLKSLQMDCVKGVINFDGLRYCNLQEVCLFDVIPENFSVFGKCTSLKTLSCVHGEDVTGRWDGRECKDVSFVKQLPELECLELSGIEGDISPILQCYNLQKLDVSYTAIDSVEQFKVLPKLRELTARGCGLKGIIDFSGFPQLKEVELMDNEFTYEQQKEMKQRYPNINMIFENRSSIY